MMLVVLAVALGFYIANRALEWNLAWLQLVLSVVPLVMILYVFRVLWKQSDHPAFHGSDGERPRSLRRRK
ncbi:hypothetical protein ACFDTO_09040 [Microbacteriaceae bacterium 4G12]